MGKESEARLKTKPGEEEKYIKWFDKNSDPYSRRCFTYAEGWAEKMEEEIQKNPDKSVEEVIKECAKRTEREEDYDGITGFMYGCACSILSQCWIHGDAFKKWKEEETNKIWHKDNAE